ncbi:MAG: TetR/AcrR family transcriptional regulator [Pseudolysinimonas sp.]
MTAGRKIDTSRDAAILDAALDVLAESGYAGITVSMVAARAKAGKATVYRRWTSKAQLVLDAVGRLNTELLDPEGLPDTGSLAGDLHALAGEEGPDEQRRLRVMVGLMSMLDDEEGLADAANAAVVEPWVAVNRVFLMRAVGRGEISAATDIETLAWVVPAMATYRVCVQRKPIPGRYVASLIDTVLLPAVGLSATARG